MFFYLAGIIIGTSGFMCFSVALQMLHFKRFISEYGPPHIIEQLKALYNEPPLAALDKIELSEVHAELIQKFSEFLDTSQFLGSTAP